MNENDPAAGKDDAADGHGAALPPSRLSYGVTMLERAAAVVKSHDTAARPDVLSGYRLADEKPLGEGGMGVVWKATQISTKRLVALKIMSAAAFGSVRAQARFEREVELTARLDHPHIARIYDSGLEKGIWYYAMELIDGRPLDAHVALHRLPRRQILELMTVICRGVQYAHQKGIVHRDLKPSNILVSDDGQPHIVDFGMAKAMASDQHLSIDGEASGTPAFMSPEQVAGKHDMLDTRSDVYALGVILFNLLTGQFPHDVSGSNIDVMKRIADDEPKSLRNVDAHADRELEVLLSKALAQEPERRYRTAGELADDLERYLKREPLIARPPTLLYVFSKKLNKHRAPVTIGAAACLILAVLATVAGVTIQRRVARQEKAMQAAGLVRRLVDAQTIHVPAIIAEMGAYREWADPLLQEECRKADANSGSRLRASLALLSVDRGQIDFLYERLLAAAPDEVVVIRDALVPYKDELVPRLWSVVQTRGNGKEESRLRAAAALARFDGGSAKWTECGSAIVTDLVRESPVYFALWSQAFAPVSNRLFPALSGLFHDSRPEHSAERNLATSFLIEYAGGDAHALADLLMDADANQFAAVFPKFRVQARTGLPLLLAEIEQTLASQPSEVAREKLAKRQANAAVALLRLNHPAEVWPLLKHTPDPRVRSYLIDRLGPFGADPRTIMKRLDDEGNLSIQQALILSLGGFGLQDFAPDQSELLMTKLKGLFRDDDSGLHSATEWLLRTWKQHAALHELNARWAGDESARARRLKDITKVESGGKPASSPRWFVNGQGQTMVVIPGPVEFMMGPPATDPTRGKDERIHRRRIGRTFALAAKPVTVEQYLRFEQIDGLLENRKRMEGLPAVHLSWHDAARYCNWLSEREGIPRDQWCYVVQDGQVKRMKESYLELTGYRLPTDAEMEYATRAGASTSRHYGESDGLLSRYAWYLMNSDQTTWPVGSKKPNEFGFFDVHGNVWCWCQDVHVPYPPTADPNVATDDTEGGLVIDPHMPRVLRGGALNAARYIQSSVRIGFVPANRNDDTGLRPARTLR